MTIQTITLTRAEGKTELCGIAYTVPTIAIADMILDQMRKEDNRGTCKVDWVITEQSGNQFSGTYHLSEEKQGFLEQHIARAKWELEFLAGEMCAATYSSDQITEKQQNKLAWIDLLKSWQ